MSLTAAAIRLMGALGLTVDQIADVADANAPEPKLSAGAERTRKWRERKAEASRGDVTETRHGDVSHVGERSQVVTPSLPSLRSEEVTSEPNGSSVNASTPAEPSKPKTKPPKSQRGTRLSEDWEPSAEEFDLARSEGLTDEEIHRAALEFRNYWCARSRDAAKLSWRLTWHNRVIEIGSRKRRDGARLASAAGQPRGGRSSVSSFADIYAKRRGQATN